MVNTSDIFKVTGNPIAVLWAMLHYKSLVQTDHTTFSEKYSHHWSSGDTFSVYNSAHTEARDGGTL